MVAAEEGAEPAEAELEEPALFVCEGADDCCDDEAPKSIVLALDVPKRHFKNAHTLSAVLSPQEEARILNQ